MLYQPVSPKGAHSRPHSPRRSASSTALQQQEQHPLADVSPAQTATASGSLLPPSGAAQGPASGSASFEGPEAFATASQGDPMSASALCPGAARAGLDTQGVPVGPAGGPPGGPCDAVWTYDRASASETGEAGSSSVALDVAALNRAVYIRSPLGTFREPLIHMKLREFSRAHHGVFGTCTLNRMAGWILTTQFLAILVGLMACPDEGWSLHSRPFIQPSTSEGAAFIYSFCSVALTYMLALKFSGPRMLAASVRVSQLVAALMVCIGFSIQIIQTTQGILVCTKDHPLACLQTSTVLYINLAYTQLQLLMFIFSMFNTLYWPRLYKWWFCTHSIRLWYLVKKHKIKLEIPDSVKRTVDAAGPRARDRGESPTVAPSSVVSICISLQTFLPPRDRTGGGAVSSFGRLE